MAKQILVVDFDAEDLGVFERALRAEQLVPVTARDLDEATLRWGEHRPDAVLVRVDGARQRHREIVQLVRAANEPQVPILFFGHGKESDPVRAPSEALAQGGDYFFRLPCDMAYLAGRARAWTERGARLPDAPPASSVPSEAPVLEGFELGSEGEPSPVLERLRRPVAELDGAHEESDWSWAADLDPSVVADEPLGFGEPLDFALADEEAAAPPPERDAAGVGDHELSALLRGSEQDELDPLDELRIEDVEDEEESAAQLARIELRSEPRPLTPAAQLAEEAWPSSETIFLPEPESPEHAAREVPGSAVSPEPADTEPPARPGLRLVSFPSLGEDEPAPVSSKPRSEPAVLPDEVIAELQAALRARGERRRHDGPAQAAPSEDHSRDRSSFALDASEVGSSTPEPSTDRVNPARRGSDVGFEAARESSKARHGGSTEGFDPRLDPIDDESFDDPTLALPPGGIRDYLRALDPQEPPDAAPAKIPPPRLPPRAEPEAPRRSRRPRPAPELDSAPPSRVDASTGPDASSPPSPASTPAPSRSSAPKAPSAPEAASLAPAPAPAPEASPVPEAASLAPSRAPAQLEPAVVAPLPSAPIDDEDTQELFLAPVAAAASKEDFPPGALAIVTAAERQRSLGNVDAACAGFALAAQIYVDHGMEVVGTSLYRQILELDPTHMLAKARLQKLDPSAVAPEAIATPPAVIIEAAAPESAASETANIGDLILERSPAKPHSDLETPFANLPRARPLGVLSSSPLSPDSGRLRSIRQVVDLLLRARAQRSTGVLRLGAGSALFIAHGVPAGLVGRDVMLTFLRLVADIGRISESRGRELATLESRSPRAMAKLLEDRCVIDADEAILLPARHLEDRLVRMLQYRGPWSFEAQAHGMRTSDLVPRPAELRDWLLELLPRACGVEELQDALDLGACTLRIVPGTEHFVVDKDQALVGLLDGSRGLEEAARLTGTPVSRALAWGLVWSLEGLAEKVERPAKRFGALEREGFGHLSRPPRDATSTLRSRAHVRPSWSPSVARVEPVAAPSAAAPSEDEPRYEAPPGMQPVAPTMDLAEDRVEALAALDDEERVRAMAEMVRTHDYFGILDVDTTASGPAIDEAHREMRQLVPDAISEELESMVREVLRSVDEARDVLMIPELRAAYEHHLEPRDR